MSPCCHSVAALFLLIHTVASEAIIEAKTDPLKVNVNFNVTNFQNYSIDHPNPDITVLSSDYYLCIWSYATETANSYSNEIYANLFSSNTGKEMVRNEFLLNRKKGRSQDTPSATTLFDEYNNLTQQVAVVWESETEDEDDSSSIKDAVYGRIIKWSINKSGGFRYVKVTSPSSEEFKISADNADGYHHRNPDVIPIYDNAKFLVTWITQIDDGDDSSTANNGNKRNMIYIRIYNIDGTAYSDPIAVTEQDDVTKKYVQTVPLLHDMTLITWLAQSTTIYEGALVEELRIYGMIFDKDGSQQTIWNAPDDDDRYIFQQMTDDMEHSIYEQTIPAIAHLHNDPLSGDNFFMLSWQSMNLKKNKNTMFAAVYVYDTDDASIRKISSDVEVFAEGGLDSNVAEIRNPQLENVQNAWYEQQMNLDAKVALCYSLYTSEHDKSDVFCKMLEVTIFNPNRAEITLITGDTMINDDSSGNHLHEHPMISSQNILRDNVEYEEFLEFVVVWANTRQNGYDVYTRVLQSDQIHKGAGHEAEDSKVFGNKLNAIIFGIVVAIVVVVIAVYIGHRIFTRHKDSLQKMSSKTRMEQIGDESDDDDEDGIITGGNGIARHDSSDNDDDHMDADLEEDGALTELTTR